ncbi:MAG: hypothetical protein KA116_13205 [Proteobacteria bacterium]|jgi:hypothetical protein|nr:hypothetical protein [Pseudomonadota bacterium]
MKVVLLLFLTSASAFSSVEVHKRTQNFVDIEVNKKDVWMDCSDHPNSGNSYLGFRVLDGDRIYSFFYRRPLTIKNCQKEEREYRKMMESEETVRIVGTSPSDEIPDPKYKYIKGIPERFTNIQKKTSSYFARLQSKNKCKAYFPNDCELPKNYWAGMISE